MKKTKPRIGRPLKEVKFDAAISFPCFKALIGRIDAYRERHRLTSRGEALRRIVEDALSMDEKRASPSIKQKRAD